MYRPTQLSNGVHYRVRTAWTLIFISFFPVVVLLWLFFLLLRRRSILCIEFEAVPLFVWHMCVSECMCVCVCWAYFRTFSFSCYVDIEIAQNQIAWLANEPISSAILSLTETKWSTDRNTHTHTHIHAFNMGDERGKETRKGSALLEAKQQYIIYCLCCWFCFLHRFVNSCVLDWSDVPESQVAAIMHIPYAINYWL